MLSGGGDDDYINANHIKVVYLLVQQSCKNNNYTDLSFFSVMFNMSETLSYQTLLCVVLVQLSFSDLEKVKNLVNVWDKSRIIIF